MSTSDTWYVADTHKGPMMMGEPPHRERFSNELLDMAAKTTAEYRAAGRDAEPLQVEGTKLTIVCVNARVVYRLMMRDEAYTDAQLEEWVDRVDASAVDQVERTYIDGKVRFPVRSDPPGAPERGATSC